ncbi:MAG: GAF domain-containing protein [Chloroflexota bacterium]
MPPQANLMTGSINEQTIIRIRARLVQVFAIISILRFVFPGAVSEIIVDGTTLRGAGLSFLLATFIFSFWIILTFLQRVNVAAFGMATTLVGLTLLPESLDQLLPLIAVIAVSTLILDWRLFTVQTVALFGLTIFQISNDVNTGQPIEQTLTQMALLVAMIAASITIRYFVSSFQRTLSIAERSAGLLRIAAEVGQITLGLVTLDELLPRSVDFIRDRFGYYHVQIFLVDESTRVAWLRASTGDVGQTLIKRGHHLNVGSESVIGQVTERGETVIARDTDQASVRYRNELLPDTRAELALPIRDGDRVIGALDVQSTRVDAFPPGDVQALQIMTNLLGTSITNAKLFEDQRFSMRENQRLYLEAEGSLREIQRLNQQLTRESWTRFVEDMGDRSGLSLEDGQIEHTSEWSNLLTQAGQTRQTITDPSDEDNLTVAVPITLRGEVIGAVEIEPDTDLDEADTIEIVKSVADRLAVSLENARLFEESQQTTFYEQRINSIVEKYQNATTVDELLQVTLQELSDTLGAQQGAIRLSTRMMEETDDKMVTGEASDQ